MKDLLANIVAPFIREVLQWKYSSTPARFFRLLAGTLIVLNVGLIAGNIKIIKTTDETNFEFSIDYGNSGEIVIISVCVLFIAFILTCWWANRDRKNRKELLEKIYKPCFDEIFSLLDVNHFADWAEMFVQDGIILQTKIDSLRELGNKYAYMSLNGQNKRLDSLLHNFGMLMVDIVRVYNIEREDRGDAYCQIAPFYKRLPFNPYYDEDLCKYEQLKFLIFDLSLEMIRLCNLILKEVRKIDEIYMPNIVLYIPDIDNRQGLANDPIEYEKREMSNSPYPGLKKFLDIRLQRKHGIRSDKVENNVIEPYLRQYGII